MCDGANSGHVMTNGDWYSTNKRKTVYTTRWLFVYSHQKQCTICVYWYSSKLCRVEILRKCCSYNNRICEDMTLCWHLLWVWPTCWCPAKFPVKFIAVQDVVHDKLYRLHVKVSISEVWSVALLFFKLLINWLQFLFSNNSITMLTILKV